MVLLLSGLVTAALADDTCPSRFEFVGQPECVQLEWTDGKTRVTNECEQPLLLDRSVGKASLQIVRPGDTVYVVDLNKFTLGLDGQLYKALARFAECAQEAPPSKPVSAGSADTGL